MNKPSDYNNDEQFIYELSQLSELDYQRCRKDKAKELGVKISILDKLVKAAQADKAESIIEEIEPYPAEVFPVELIQEIEAVINNYVVLPTGAIHAVSLWCLGTYAFDDFHIYPKLLFHSPEKRCGKSTALDVVEALSNRALFSSNITPAAIFRVIEKYHPTLIIDEADTFISGRNDDLIGIINSGHAKNRAFVFRTVGDAHEPKAFSTWSPQVFASIKRLQDTVMDRSIVIELRRKTVDEKTSRIPATLKTDLTVLRQKIARWYLDNRQIIISNIIEPHYSNNDRAIDNWIPLFSIANSISPECLASCKNAYNILNNHEDEKSIQIQLLEDIREVFSETDLDRMPSELLVEKLVSMSEHPWCEWKHGQPMTVNSLAKLLKDFGIKSKQYRDGLNRHRGFERIMFEDAFKRYLPALALNTLFTRAGVTMASDKAISDSQPVTVSEGVTGTKPLQPAPDKDCHTGTTKTGKNGREEVIL